MTRVTDDGGEEEEMKPGFAGALEIYADLYPSIRERVRVITASADPLVRTKLALIERMEQQRGGTRESEMIQRFGLTRSEAKLAAWLADGGTVVGYARTNGVSPGTARSHLKAVFAKTGVHRQVQLASLVLSRRRFGPI